MLSARRTSGEIGRVEEVGGVLVAVYPCMWQGVSFLDLKVTSYALQWRKFFVMLAERKKYNVHKRQSVVSGCKHVGLS